MLSDEQIEKITGASRARASMWLVASAIARAIEAEVRKDDEALIRQMREAVDLGKKLALTGGVFTTPELALLTAASTAATARLEEAP